MKCQERNSVKYWRNHWHKVALKSLEGTQIIVCATDTKKMCWNYFLCHAVTSY